MSASAFNTLAHLDVENRRVLVRLDLDQAQDLTFRPKIRDSSLSTIKELLHRGARVILAGHRSPAPGSDTQLPSLRRTGSRLAQALDCPVQLPDEVVGDGVRKLIRDTRGGQIVLLENLDFDPRERSGNPELGKQLAELCDIFVLDAVAAMGDSRASVTQLAARMPEPARGVGHRLEAHLEIAKRLSSPTDEEHTLIFGAQAPDLVTLAALAKLVELRSTKDPLILSGPLGVLFQRLQAGQSIPEIDPSLQTHMRAILERIAAHKLKLILPPQGADTQGFGESGRRDVISTLHLPQVTWMGPFGPDPQSEDDRWLALRLAQHERELMAVGPEALTALGEALPDSAPAQQGLDLGFVLTRIAKAPLVGLEAIAVQEQTHES